MSAKEGEAVRSVEVAKVAVRREVRRDLLVVQS